MAEIEYRDYSKARLSKEEFREILKKSVVVREVDVEDLVFLEKNANVMEGEVLRRLVENIEHDGILTQLPFVQRLPNGKYEIISGNHRVKASIEAGLILLRKFQRIICLCHSHRFMLVVMRSNMSFWRKLCMPQI